MLLDAPFHVVGYVCSDDNAVLGAAVHRLRIYVVMLFIVLYEPSVLLECVEILYSFVIHFRVMLVCAGCEIYLRFDDVVERARIPFGLFAGFFGVEHVVGA